MRPRDKRLRLALHAMATSAVPGAVAEVGVYRGGSARILAQALPDRELFLFDTFVGMPDQVETPDNHHQAGDFADTSVEAVRQQVPFAVLLSGVFPATAAALPPGATFCLVHIDVDLYRSTLDALNFFWPRIVAGGRVVLDDHNCPTCRGATQAAREFFADLNCGRGADRPWTLHEARRGAWAQK